MSKYLKSYKTYPAGTIIVAKKYSLWKRFTHWLLKKRRNYNFMVLMPSESKLLLSKLDLLLNDYTLYIPKKAYTKREKTKLEVLLNSSLTKEDALVAINAIRHNTVNSNEPLEQFKDNNNYTKVYLDDEPFQDLRNYNKDDEQRTKHIHSIIQ